MSEKILIVEDEADLSLLLGYNLEAEGYVVENVERGDEAELRLAENAPDLVILDWMLPGVSGLEICRRLRARESTRTLPVIMVTARGEEAERVRGLSVGADDYVVKPFSVPELMARVRALLRRSRPERIAERLNAGDLDLDRETRRVRRGGAEDRFDQQRMLGDRENLRPVGLAVPARDAGEAVGDVGDFDVERGGVQQVEPAPRQHPLPGARRFGLFASNRLGHEAATPGALVSPSTLGAP